MSRNLRSIAEREVNIGKVIILATYLIPSGYKVVLAVSELSENIAGELYAIRIVVEELTGLPSRWSGKVVVIDSLESQILKGRDVLAEKQWDCGIIVNASIAMESIRWRTLIHEMLHSVSVGMRETDYKRFRGWEEAVVEQLQRCLRPQILNQIGVDVAETVFAQAETFWLYNRYIEAMESLRKYLGQEETSFYLELLKIPLADRLAYVYAQNSSEAYRRLFALAIGKLR